MKQSKSSRDWSFRIKDILHAIEKIEQYTNGMTFAEFRKNELIIDAVIRNLEVVGEASNAIPNRIQNTYSHVPWRQIVGLRNILIHEYFGIDVNAVWHTIHKHLPLFKQQAIKILEHEISP